MEAAAAGDADGDGDRAVDDDEMASGGASTYMYVYGMYLLSEVPDLLTD